MKINFKAVVKWAIIGMKHVEDPIASPSSWTYFRSIGHIWPSISFMITEQAGL